jgi:hypothetical protein
MESLPLLPNGTKPRRPPRRRPSVVFGYQTCSTDRIATPLTPAQILTERLHLAQDMLFLVLRDGMPLAPPVRRKVERMFAELGALRKELEAP